MLSKGTDIASFDDIIDNVWSPAQVNNETVTQRVRLLRLALEDTDKENPKYIRSVRGKGYQLCQAPTQVSAPCDSKTKKQSVFYALGSVALVSLLLVLAILLFPGNEKDETVTKSIYQERLERAQFYLRQRESEDIKRALDLLAQTQRNGQTDPQWLITKSFSLSTKVCRFGGAPELTMEAQELAEKALALSGTSHGAMAVYAKAYAFDCRGELENAIDTYRRAMDMHPTVHPGITSSLAYLLGEKGQLAASLAWHRQLFEEAAKEDFLYLQLGRNYQLLQYDELAEHFYSLSFELYPENVFSNTAYPRFLFYQGKYNEAKALMDAAESRPAHADLHVLIAEWHLLSNSYDEARHALKNAIKLKPDLAYLHTLHALHQPVVSNELLLKRLNEMKKINIEQASSANVFLERSLIHKQLGETSLSYHYLLQAIESGFLDRLQLDSSPLLAPLRELPSFDEALRLLDEKVASQRAQLPAEHLTITLHEHR